MTTRNLLITFLLCLGIRAFANDIVWFDGQRPVSYEIKGKVDPVVMTALQMFDADMLQVTGMRPVTKAKASIRIIQRKGTDDGFRISVNKNRQIVIEGHNGRGCAYGILELSRMAGVSPWVWWGDVIPEKKTRLSLPDTFTMEHTPSVQYRGIFINDEDWSLRNWSVKTFERLGKGSGLPKENVSIGPKTYKEIFKLLLRLRANTIWPAMHEGGTGFFTVKGNKEAADSCGILIGSSHCEPLLRNNVAEWNHAQRGAYNYITNREEVKRYWAERLQEVKGSEELFTIGMRGIHDGSMEGVKTPEEKLNGLQQVIDDQRELIRLYYNNKVEEVPQVFIPYKEVLEIMESGLRVPDDVTLMWCDDNYGYLTRLPDAQQQKRKGGGGVYYHLSYWGRPHDHLWLTTTQPGLIYSEMKTAYDNNCRRLWIANVHDPKVAAYDLELFLDMAWDINSLSPAPSSREKKVITLEEHLERWLCCQFGQEVGRQLLPVMKDFYHLNAIRKPEFMGWTQVELDKKRYPGGKSRVGSIELTQQEAYALLIQFERMKAVVDRCRQLVRPELQDAYFAHIIYPVYASAAMNRKIVSGQAESHRAYEEIQQLTAQYNALNNGKWQGLMSAAPRSLPVFEDVNGQLSEDSIPFTGIARQAADYDQASTDVKTISMLGHSMQAVSIPKGEWLEYRFEISKPVSSLYTAMIPTQPSDRGDLRYSVQIDDQEPVVISLKEPYRSERWKQNVLRGQALRKTPIRLSEGKHTLRIKALDNHIIFDQWMIDTEKDRQFYVIPTSRRASQQLWQSFLTPPDSIRVGCYYYWVNEQVDPKGVVADLQWMKDNGITLAFLATDIRNRVNWENPWEGQTFGKNKFQSKLWWENLRTALKTAGELDIEMGLFNCPGWSQSGGPWIRPEEAMRNWTPDGWEVCKTNRGTDVVCSPCSPEAEGLEVDKLSKTHVKKHFEAFIGEILRRIPASERPTLTTVVVDSWERGKQNYTDSIFEKFRQRFGYDLDYQDKACKKDLDQLIAELIASEYMGGLTEKAHEYGLRTWCEPYAHSPFPGNSITYGSAADEVAAEFWVADPKFRKKEMDAALGAARRSRKNRVWAESFTAGWPEETKDDWSFEKLKPIADRYFHAGVNASILHVMISQPGDESKPAIRPWFGTYFDRRSKNAKDLKPLVQYLRRCNFMLQLGHPYQGATDQRIMDDGTIIRFTDDSQFEIIFPDGHQEIWDPLININQ